MLLSASHISKAFGAEEILRDVSFHIEAHERCAIVGINGAGKTTLLRILTGELPPDSGSVTLEKGARIGYLAQQDMLAGHRSIYEEVAEAKRAQIDLEQRLRGMEARMNEVSGDELTRLMDQYHRAQTDFEQLGGYAWKSEVTGVLRGLGFAPEEWDRPADTLSGGQKTRLALGRLLLTGPDLLLLDEPTNHLDLEAVTWLEGYLSAYRGAVLVVAHDRYFLEHVAQRILEVDRGEVTSFPCRYSDYAERKKALREEKMRAWLNQQAEIKHQKEVITKLKSFNREKSIRRAESREKMLEKMDVLEKPTETPDSMHLTLRPAVRSGEDVLQIEDLSMHFDDEPPLFTGLSLSIRRGEHVALIGSNGAGKSTILRILTGRLKPDTGRIRLGANVHIGYYDQEQQVLHPDKTLFDEISDTRPDLTNTEVRSLLASFLFTGEDVFKYVRDLSGGERGRLSLARLMLSESNFLLLDEPTNHLDIVSREILEDALNRYEGTVLVVSHDRYFMNRTAHRTLDLSGGRLTDWPGNYDYYLEKSTALAGTEGLPSSRTAAVHRAGATAFTLPGGSAGAASAARTQDKRSAGPSGAGAADAVSSGASAFGVASGAPAGVAAASGASTEAAADWKKQKQQQAAERKRANDLAKTEASIAELEARDAEIDKLLEQEEVFTDLAQVTKLTEEKATLADTLAKLYERWEELAE